MSLPIEPPRGTQASAVLAHIRVYGFITQKEATKDLLIFSLPARISDLKYKYFWPIHTETMRPSGFSRYTLK